MDNCAADGWCPRLKRNVGTPAGELRVVTIRGDRGLPKLCYLHQEVEKAESAQEGDQEVVWLKLELMR